MELQDHYPVIPLKGTTEIIHVNMSSYWSKRRRVLRATQMAERQILFDFESALDNPAAQVPPSPASPRPASSMGLDEGGGDSVAWGGCSDAESDSSSTCSEGDYDSHVDSDSLEEPGLHQKLKHWAASFSVPLIAITALLTILRKSHPELPKDARTLLGTRPAVPVQTVGNGEYFHFGLTKGILSKLSTIHLPNAIETITLQFNIDGLPIFKSSKLQFWPILAMIDCDYTRMPFVVGIFCGTGKPSNVFDYLRQFVNELSDLLSSGITFGGRVLRVAISSFICDAPARAFVKQIKSHNGYSGCDKCCQTGNWQNKMTYPETEVRLRSDDEFETMADEDHHINRSPVTGLVKMVSAFPIDYMHLCCLGVMRKLINFWMRGKNSTRQPIRAIKAISEQLVQLRPYTPTEFARKPRELNELDRWKAAELRQFMIYTGPLVLRDTLSHNLYDNFMLFSVAMCLLLTPNISDNMVSFAQKLLAAFVKHFGQVYGKEEIVFSVHQTIHLTDEYRQYGSLDNISSFPYENYLGKIKKMLRKPSQPLQQVVKRLSEEPVCLVPPPPTQPALLHPHQEGPLPQDFRSGQQFKKVQLNNFCLALKQGDNCIMIKNKIGIVQNIIKHSDSVFVVYKTFKHRESYFNYPCPSTNIGCFRVFDIDSCLNIDRLEVVQGKCVLFPDGQNFVAIPLRHHS
ncbi:hypothetical protein ACEWY4_001562 [Coilia grayii]|uniref:Transposase domain-containing protein n=1 Tax=Coilia grayii TaxID=363190 RepID=A0ABD1KTA5_9TELE